MVKVPTKALRAFNKNGANSMITGNPASRSFQGRFPLIEKEDANILAASGDVELIDHEEYGKQLKRWEKQDGLDSKGRMVRKSARSVGGRMADQQIDDAMPADEVRANRLSGGATPKIPGTRGRKPKAAKEGGPPAGGSSTVATTNHPKTGPNPAEGETDPNAEGQANVARTDPDAAPTGGGKQKEGAGG